MGQDCNYQLDIMKKGKKLPTNYNNNNNVLSSETSQTTALSQLAQTGEETGDRYAHTHTHTHTRTHCV